MIPTRTPAKWKRAKAFSDARNILLEETGPISQKDNINDFKSMCTDKGRSVWATIMLGSVKILRQTHEHWKKTIEVN